MHVNRAEALPRPLQRDSPLRNKQTLALRSTEFNYSSLKMQPVRFCFYFYFQSVSQIGTLETLIGSRALYCNRVLLLLLLRSSGINGEVRNYVLAGQVGPFHLTLIQINSEMNCIAKKKCPESQKLDTRHRGENLIAHTATIHFIWPRYGSIVI